MNAGAKRLTIQSLTDQISDLGEYLSTWLDVATDIDCLSCHKNLELDFHITQRRTGGEKVCARVVHSRRAWGAGNAPDIA